MSDGIRTDQWRVTATLEGTDLGVFDKKGGGIGDSSETKYRKGGMKRQKALGGPQTTSDLTLTRIYDPDVDDSLMPLLHSRRGKGRMVAAQQRLDIDGNPAGDPRIWTGILKSCHAPDVDSEAAGPGLFEVVMSCDADIA